MGGWNPATRNWLLTLGVSGVNALTGILTGILVARLLEPAGRGALAELMLWPALIASLALLSLPGGVALEVARSPQDRHPGLASTAVVLALVLSAAGVALGYPALAFLVDEVAFRGLAQAYLALFLPLQFVAMTLLALDQGRQRFRRYNVLRLLPQTIYLILLAALWLSGLARIATVIWVAWAGTAVTTIVRLLLARSDLDGRPSLPVAAMLVRNSGLIHLATVIGLLATQVDRIVIVSLYPHEAVGHYMVALTAASAAFGLVASAFHATVLPEVASRRPDDAARLALRRLAQTFLLTGALSLLMLPIIPLALPLLFGAAFAPAVPIALLLLAALAPLHWNGVAIVALRALGDWQAGVVAQVIALGGFLAFVWLLRGQGILAVPLALLIGHSACAAYLGWRMRRWMAGSPGWLSAIAEACRAFVGMAGARPFRARRAS